MPSGYIINKTLFGREYIDGLEPKRPITLRPITIFKLQNWLVGELPGPISRLRCKATTWD